MSSALRVEDLAFDVLVIGGGINGVAIAQIFNFSLVPIGNIHTLSIMMPDTGIKFADPAILRGAFSYFLPFVAAFTLTFT